MKLAFQLGAVLALAVGLAFAQPTATSTARDSTKAVSVSLRFASVHGDTFDIAKLKQPLVLLVSGTDSASHSAAEAVQQAFAAATEPAIFLGVIEAGMNKAKAVADQWELGYMVLSDSGHRTMEWLSENVPAQVLSHKARVPFVAFMDAASKVIKADTGVTEAKVIQGVTALVKKAETDKVTDPVCGMSITKASAAATYDYNGQTYYFCSTTCRDSFVQTPQKYLAK